MDDVSFFVLESDLIILKITPQADRNRDTNYKFFLKFVFEIYWWQPTCPDPEVQIFITKPPKKGITTRIG